MINKSELVSIRPGQIQDRNFILATWLKGLRFGNDWFELIESHIYFAAYHQVIDSILANPETLVAVACLKEDPEVILGYSIANQDTLHWVFVKKAWRSIGIAKSLVSDTTTTVTHVTDTGRSILRKRPGVRFNPFAMG